MLALRCFYVVLRMQHTNMVWCGKSCSSFIEIESLRLWNTVSFYRKRNAFATCTTLLWFVCITYKSRFLSIGSSLYINIVIQCAFGLNNVDRRINIVWYCNKNETLMPKLNFFPFHQILDLCFWHFISD